MTINHIKWAATATLIAGTALNLPSLWPLGPVLMILGGIQWLWVAWVWREASLIVTNAALVTAGIVSVVATLLMQ